MQISVATVHITMLCHNKTHAANLAEVRREHNFAIYLSQNVRLWGVFPFLNKCEKRREMPPCSPSTIRKIFLKISVSIVALKNAQEMLRVDNTHIDGTDV
jgi:hypothetical protein